MPRSYRHVQQYEKETLRMRETGMTRREIGEKLRLKRTNQNVHKSLQKKQMKIEAGIALRKKADHQKIML